MRMGRALLRYPLAWDGMRACLECEWCRLSRVREAGTPGAPAHGFQPLLAGSTLGTKLE